MLYLHKHNKQASTLLLTLMIFGCIASFPIANATDGVYTKKYAYSYGQYDWTFTVSIPKSVYDSYKTVPVSYRVQNGPAGYGYLTTTQEQYLIDIANELKRSATEKGYGEYETVSLILAFVQSLPYTSDSSTAAYDEYPRFPIETLVDDGGDCEDTSILFACLMAILGYGVIYISPPEHLAVGILGEDTVQGTYWTFENQRYYYCETTGNGFEIGELPSDYSSNQKAYLYKINLSDQYIPSQNPVLTDQDNVLPTDPTAPITDLTFPLVTVMIVVGVVVIISLQAASKNKKNQAPNYPASTMYNQPQSPSIQAWLCPNCKTQNPADAIFCKKCGNKIK